MTEPTVDWIAQFVRESNAAWPARPWPPLSRPGMEALEISAYEPDPACSRSAYLLSQQPALVVEGARMIARVAGCSLIRILLPHGVPHQDLAAPDITLQFIRPGPCDTQVPDSVPVELLARLALAARQNGDAEQERAIARRRFVTVLGDVAEPGVIEVEPEESIREVVFGRAGGLAGSRLAGVIVGGHRGIALGERDLDRPAAQALRTFSPSILVVSDQTCPVQVISLMVHMAAEEGCAHGAQDALRELDGLLTALVSGKASEGILDRLLHAEGRLRSRPCAGAAGVGKLVHSALSAFRKAFAEHAAGYCRASICQDLFPAPCQNHCPAGVNLPGQVSLMRRGRYREALALGRVSNPFLISCGYACQDPPCQQVCRRQQIDSHISAPLLHRAAAAGAARGARDWSAALAASAPAAPLPRTKKRVAVVGAGPAGLSAAFFLSRYGHDVTVLEALPEPGGMLTYGIPAFRLPRSVVQAEIDDVRRQGVKIECGRRLGADFTLSDLRAQYDAVVLALGAQRPGRLDIPGENLPRVYHGIDFLRRVALGDAPKVGSRTVIVGGGTAALDCARTAWRLGADEVHLVCLEARNRMPAHEGDIAAALEEGIQLHDGFGPRAIIPAPRGELLVKFRRAEQVYDRQGRFAPRLSAAPGFRLTVSSVIIAAGEALDPSGVDDGLLLAAGGERIAVGSDLVTTAVQGVFAAGDCAAGPQTVVEAVSSGRRAARAVDRYLGGDPVRKDGRLALAWQWPVPPYPVDVTEQPAAEPARIPVEDRRGLDVFCEEPMPDDWHLRELARCLCVAHPGPGRHWDA